MCHYIFHDKMANFASFRVCFVSPVADIWAQACRNGAKNEAWPILAMPHLYITYLSLLVETI